MIDNSKELLKALFPNMNKEDGLGYVQVKSVDDAAIQVTTNGASVSIPRDAIVGHVNKKDIILVDSEGTIKKVRSQNEKPNLIKKVSGSNNVKSNIF